MTTAKSNERVNPNKVTQKPIYKTLTVAKDDGTYVEVSRASMEDYNTVKAIQDRLLQKYIEADLAFGELIADAKVRGDLVTLCSLLPIVPARGATETAYLDFNDICDNWEQLIRLFFNNEFDEESREVTGIAPSLVSNLHFLPYKKMWNEHRLKLESQEKDLQS